MDLGKNGVACDECLDIEGVQRLLIDRACREAQHLTVVQMKDGRRYRVRMSELLDDRQLMRRMQLES